MTANVGIAERSERLIVVLVLKPGCPDCSTCRALLRTIALWGLAVATTITVVQRIVEVRRQITSRRGARGSGRAGVNDAVVDAAYATGWSVVRGMPERLARRQFDAAATHAVWFRSGRSVQRLQSNLARVVPSAGERELRLLTRDAVRSYLRYWCARCSSSRR